MTDIETRAIKILLIIIVVVPGLIIAFRSPNNEQDVPVAGQTPVKVADIPQNAVEDEYETIVKVMAYCSGACCCGKFADGITASGHVIQPGDKFVAAPKHIPFGTMLNIPSYGTVPVLDRGGAIKGRRLDVFFDDANGISGHQRALNWGVKYLEIEQWNVQ